MKKCLKSIYIYTHLDVLITPDPVTEFSIDACCFRCKLANNFTSHNRKFPLEHTGILGNVRVFLWASIRAQAELHMPQAYRISLLDIQSWNDIGLPVRLQVTQQMNESQNARLFFLTVYMNCTEIGYCASMTKQKSIQLKPYPQAQLRRS